MAGVTPQPTAFPADLDKENQFRRRQYFLQGMEVRGIWKMPKGAANNYLLTSDAYGVGTWQSAASLSTGALADFWYKPGIALSFTAYMRTSSGGSGTISSTAHATKGFMYLGASTAYDEANIRLGIGTLTPTARLHLLAPTTGSSLTTNSDIANNWAGPYTGGGTPAGGTSSAALASNDGTTTYMAIKGDGTNGTNPQKNGLNGTVTAGLTYSVTLSLFCLGGTMTAGSNFSISLVTSAGTKFDSATLDLVGITTTPTTIVMTVNTASGSSGSGTANSIELNASCVPTGFYTCVSYLSVASGGDIVRWDTSGGTQLGRLDNAGRLGVGTAANPLTAMGTLQCLSAATPGLYIKAFSAAQSASLFECQTSSGTAVTTVSAEGVVTIQPSTNTPPLIIQNTSAQAIYKFFQASAPRFTMDSFNTAIPSLIYLQATSAGSYIFIDGGASGEDPEITLVAAAGRIPRILGSVSGGTEQLRLGTSSASTTYAVNIGVNGVGTVAINPVGNALAASVPLTISGSTAQSGHLVNLKNVGGTILSAFGSDGALLLGDTTGASYYALVPGDDLTVQDDAGLNLLTVRDVTTWADSVAGYQMLPGNASPTNRNLMLSGFSVSGSVFDRLGIQALGVVIRGSTAATMPAPSALLDIRQVVSTSQIGLKVVPIAASSVSTLAIRDTTDASSVLSVARDGATVIAPIAGTALTLTPPSGTAMCLNSSHTDTAFPTAGTGQTGGIWLIAPTLRNAGVAITGITNVVGITPTVYDILDTTVHGCRVIITGSLNPGASAGTSFLTGMSFQAESDPAVTSGIDWGGIAGITGNGTHSSPDTASLLQGIQASVVMSVGAGAVTTGHGIRLATTINTGTTISTCNGLSINNPTGSGTITTWNGISIPAQSTGATRTTANGIIIGNLTKGTTNWSLAIGTSSSAARSFHWANIYIGGNTTPTARCHFAAQTTAASTAPIKFTSGTVMTTAEAGAFEFTTDDFFATITTGAARKAFVLDDGTRLTLGRIPKATTNGRLIDGSSFVGTPVVVGDDPPAVASGALGKVDLTAQTADIGSTALTNTPGAGVYRISCVLEDTTADLTAGTVTATFSWTDDVGATTTAITQTLVTAGRTNLTHVVYVASGNISYATTHTGIFGTSAYAIRIRIEALS